MKINKKFSMTWVFTCSQEAFEGLMISMFYKHAPARHVPKDTSEFPNEFALHHN